MINALSPPIIELRVQNMKHAIMNALCPEDIRDQIQAHLDAAIAAFDFGKEVRECATRVIRDKMGEAIRHAIDSAMWEPEIKDLIQSQVLKAIKRNL